MLKIFNDLSPFIEDCYRELGVREYSRIAKTTAPTASKLLKKFESEDLLKKRIERGFLLSRSNRENPILKDLSRIYWRQKLKPLISYINDQFHFPTIILFGSLAKLETKKNSDIDLAVFTDLKKNMDLDKFEKDFNRKIQIFKFKVFSEISSKELKTNIINGYIIQGEIK